MRECEHPLAYNHNIFEQEFIDLCEKKGLYILDMSYHHLYPDRTKALLRQNTSPVSLLIRTSPDFLVLNGDDGTYYELKTGANKNHLSLEAYPLMCNKIHSISLGIPCIYVYKGVITDNNIVACPVEDINASILVIPKDKKNNAIEDTLKQFYNCPYKYGRHSNIYSNDAYVRIPAEQVQSWIPVNEYLKA